MDAVTRTKISLPFEIAIAISAGLVLPLIGALLPTALAGRADFKNMFQAGAIVWSGAPSRMYQVSIFNHLPFEALLFAPLARLGYAGAYLAFAFGNCLLLWLALRKLRIRGIWIAATCAFAPVGLAFLQGQDSIITLALLAWAAAALGDGHELGAGALVGLTIYKPQIGLPICVLMLVWKRWRFVGGFCAAAGAGIVASIATVGPEGFVKYIEMLRSMNPAKYGIVDSDMVGLRGLLSAVMAGHALLVATLVATIAVLIYAFRKGRGSPARSQLDVAIATCCLVSYHMLPYDLTILLVPLASAWKRGDRSITWASIALFVFAGFLARTRENQLMAIPLLVFWVLLAQRPRMPEEEPRLAAVQVG